MLPPWDMCGPRVSYALGVDLGDVGQPFGHNVARHLVAVLVFELGSLALGTLRERPGICDGTGHDATNGGRDLENVGHGGGINELVLIDSVSSWPSCATHKQSNVLEPSSATE